MQINRKRNWTNATSTTSQDIYPSGWPDSAALRYQSTARWKSGAVASAVLPSANMLPATHTTQKTGPGGTPHNMISQRFQTLITLGTRRSLWFNNNSPMAVMAAALLCAAAFL